MFEQEKKIYRKWQKHNIISGLTIDAHNIS